MVIDGHDLRLTTAGKLEQEASRIVIREGGQIEIAQHSTNLITTSAVDCSRPLDLSDRYMAEWWDTIQNGAQELRNGVYYLTVAGVDVAKRVLEEVMLLKFSDLEGDAKNEDEPQMETFTFQPKRLGKLEKL